MGLDLGFNAYRKEGNKYQRVKLDDKLFPNWMCGRTELNYRLGDIIEGSDNATVCFDADVDGKYMHFNDESANGSFVLKDTQSEYDKDFGSGYNRLYFVDFDDFMQKAEDIFEDAEEDIAEEDEYLKKRIAEAEEYLNKLLQLQLTASDQTAYENAAKMVADAKSDLFAIKGEVNDNQDKKLRIDRAREMFLTMKKLHSLGFFVLPYYSY